VGNCQIFNRPSFTYDNRGVGDSLQGSIVTCEASKVDWGRLDMPAVLDAIFHALEKAEFCVDDTLIWIAQSSRSYDKTAPGCTITFLD
jgi:predicted alpha/beta hydrolase